MQSLKKSVLFLLMAVVVASVAVAPAHAQSARVSANVPFDFVLGKTTMKAGSYRIEKQGSFIALVSEERKTRYALLFPGGDEANHNNEPYLIFTRYGTESFLNKVVFSATDTYDLPRSSREKEVMADLTHGEQVAVLIQAGQ